MILYLHGFASSCNSRKATTLSKFMKARAIEVIHPTLPVSPFQAVGYVSELLSKYDFKMVIGSSLGGFYALQTAQNFRGKTVLINPAIKPSETLADYVGLVKRSYSDEFFYWTEKDVEELRSLEKQSDFRQLDQSKLYFFLSEDDEILDLSEIPKVFPIANIYWYPDAKHAFTVFDQILPKLLELYLLQTN